MRVLSRIAPRATARANFVWDIAAVIVAIVAFGGVFGAGLRAFVGPIMLATVVWGFGGFVLRFYDPWARRFALDDAAMLSLLVGGELVTNLALDLLSPHHLWVPHPVRFAGALWAMIVLPRLFIFRKLARRERPLDEVLIVGTSALGRFTGEDMEARRQPRRKVVGYLRMPEERSAAQIRGVQVLGDVTDLPRILQTLPVSEVYLAGNGGKHERALQQAVQVCERYGMPFAVPAFTFRLTRARPAQPGVTNDGYLHFVHVRSNPYQAALKRLFDIVASSAALVLLSPLFLAVAAAIKLTSRGPVFFKQQRVGLHGRPFNMLKFRSMVVNAEQLKAKLAAQNEQRGPVFKMKNDPRVTGIGRFIRKYSIDELPQLLNVLRGEMSVVGPRPPVPKEVAEYEPWQRRRLSVRPGLTCIWQVSGRNQITFEEWMRLDMQYIDHWSLGRDMSLVLQTVPVVLTGRGAS